MKYMRVLSRGGTVDSDSSDVEYFKFNQPIISGYEPSASLQMILTVAASTIKGVTSENRVSITTVTTYIDYTQTNNTLAFNTISAFSYLPIDASGNLLKFTDFANLVLTNLGLNILETVTPITKEEFYDLNNI